MKQMKLWMLAAILFCGVSGLISCNGNSNKDTAADTDSVVAQEIEEDIVTRDSIGFPVFGTLYNYLVDSIGSRYSQGDVCIPSIVITAAGNPDSEDNLIKILGDFWVFNYKIVGDTLIKWRTEAITWPAPSASLAICMRPSNQSTAMKRLARMFAPNTSHIM